jgi:hypothetical protein
MRAKETREIFGKVRTSLMNKWNNCKYEKRTYALIKIK